MLRGELVTGTARFDEVAGAWDGLWARSGRSLFQSHGWVRAWWSAVEATGRSRLHIGLCWEGDQLRAVVPCATRRHRGLRVLEWAAKECSDYCDVISGPGSGVAAGDDAGAGDGEALAQAWAAAWAAVGSGGFQVAYLSHIRPDATFRRVAGVSAGCALRPSARADQTLQVRRGGLTGAGWFRALSKKARNNHTRGKRIVSEVGVELDGGGAVSAGVATGADAERKFEQMIAFKCRWLRATNRQSAMLRDDARVLRSLVGYLRGCGALQVFSLDCDGALAAGLVSIEHGRQVAAFFSAFDPRFERASPGTLVLVEQVMWAFERGVPEVDFLCGDEGYKSKFANASIDLSAYVGARTGVGHTALAVGEWLDRRRGAAAGLAGPGAGTGTGLGPGPGLGVRHAGAVADLVDV